MKPSRMMCVVLTVGLFAGHATAALSVNIIDNTGDAPAGQVSNDITADSDFDVTSAALFITLDTGTLYNNNVIVPGIEIFQQSPGDTFVTINDNPNTFVAGAAGDLGHINPLNFGAAEFGPNVLGVTWGNTATTDIGSGIFLGSFSFSEDASGTGRLLVLNSNLMQSQDFFGISITTEFVFMDVTVTNGVLTPEPSTFGLLVLGSAALLRSRRSVV